MLSCAPNHLFTLSDDTVGDVAIVDVVVAINDAKVAIAKPSVAHITFFVALDSKYVANEESSRLPPKTTFSPQI